MCEKNRHPYRSVYVYKAFTDRKKKENGRVQDMNKKLLNQALIKFFAGLLTVGALLFIPAGSMRFWNGWLLITILFVPMLFAGFILMAKNPDLLRRRLSA